RPGRARDDEQALAPVRPRIEWSLAALNEGALARLELPAVRRLLAERTAFAPGRELAEALFPTTDLREAERLQDETAAGRDLLRLLQDPIVTQRGGRYVVPVKAEHRAAVKGIVHDQSASGQTVFIEPLEIMEANNALREAELAERIEVERILDELSRRIEKSSEDLDVTTTALAALDLILAKALYADSLQATRPELNAEGILDLVDARHPL